MPRRRRRLRRGESNGGGTDVTLVVEPMPIATITAWSGSASYAFEAIDPRWSEGYGSTYGSNCSCLFCIKYCDVNGVTTKSGTCC
jgi:hypothetical protein